MPPRRSATATVEPEETEAPEPEKASIKETVLEVLNELGITRGETPTEEETTTEEPAAEEIESPRQQEAKMKRAVEGVIGELHIHTEQKHEEPKKEPEETPGKPSFLQKLIGLS